jgi:hypothetical protein
MSWNCTDKIINPNYCDYNNNSCEDHTYSQDGDRYCEKFKKWLEVVWLGEYHAEGLKCEECTNE